MICLQTDHPVQIGQNGEDIKGECHIVLNSQIVDEPHRLSNDQNCFEHGLILDIYHPCVETRRNDRKPADPAQSVDLGRQQDLYCYNKQLYRYRQRTFQTKQISYYTDQTGYRAGHTSEYDVCSAHQTKHSALCQKNGFSGPDEANGDHECGACKRNNIPDNDHIHSDPPK